MLIVKHDREQNRQWLSWLMFFGIAMLSLILVYGHSLQFFFWQDDFNLLEFVNSKSLLDYVLLSFVKPEHILPLNLGVVFRPIPHYIYFKTLYLFAGLNPIPYRIVNLAVVIIISILVAQLTTSLTSHRVTGFFAGILFIINRVNFAPIYWISANNELFAVLFVLISVVFYIKGTDAKRYSSIILALSHFSLVMALLCKETAIVSPGLIVLSVLLRLDNRNVRGKIHNCVGIWPQIIIVVTFLLIRTPFIMYALKGGGGSYYTTSKTFLLPIHYLWGLWWNIETFVEPWRVLLDSLTHTFSFFQPIYVSGLIIILFLFAALLLIKTTGDRSAANPIWLGLAWFIISAFPALVTGILVDYIFELPAFGFVLIVAYILERLILSMSAGSQTKYILTLITLLIFSVLSARLVVAQQEITTWPVKNMPLALETIKVARGQPLATTITRNICLVDIPSETWWPGRLQPAFNVFVRPNLSVYELTSKDIEAGRCPPDASRLRYTSNTIVVSPPGATAQQH